MSTTRRVHNVPASPPVVRPLSDRDRLPQKLGDGALKEPFMEGALEHLAGPPELAADCAVRDLDHQWVSALHLQTPVLNEELCLGCMACMAQCAEREVAVEPRAARRHPTFEDLLR
jgi:NAD-dependent dihydropyrimidine dehydrogenase PreA subunit